MTNHTDGESMSRADPRHRSFHLTRPAAHLADGATVPVFASGWVRIIESKETPIAIRISSITQVIGPYEATNQWVVRLVSPDGTTEPIGFDDKAAADNFVDDLLHD